MNPADPGRPSWTASRIARPSSDLAAAAAFYGDLLGLRVTGRFDGHAGYDGRFFALPGGGELELTAGPAAVAGGTEEDLLVLYLASPEEVRVLGARLVAAGVSRVTSPNPYWEEHGQTFLDPDGRRVVVAWPDRGTAEPAPDVAIDWHPGPRAQLRPLFELAEDSAVLLDAYLDAGRVLVARSPAGVVGHLQLVPTGQPGEREIKNLAVLPSWRGTGVGRALVEAAVEHARSERSARLVVATGAADVGVLRFYQRVGFRLDRVEPDAFVPATGYPEPILVDGIRLRDRVWLFREL